MTHDTHETIITRLMAEARLAFADGEKRKRSAIAEQTWARRREQMTPKRKPEA